MLRKADFGLSREPGSKAFAPWEAQEVAFPFILLVCYISPYLSPFFAPSASSLLRASPFALFRRSRITTRSFVLNSTLR